MLLWHWFSAATCVMLYKMKTILQFTLRLFTGETLQRKQHLYEMMPFFSPVNTLIFVLFFCYEGQLQGYALESYKK